MAAEQFIAPQFKLESKLYKRTVAEFEKCVATCDMYRAERFIREAELKRLEETLAKLNESRDKVKI